MAGTGDGGALVSYALDDGVATIAMDDGKANVLSPAMFVELGAALDRAEAGGAVVVLAGRDGVFSGGFDLAVLQGGGAAAANMLLDGFELSYRLLSFPAPVVIACTGHAIAMGVFTLLSGDLRIGAAGASHKITANEVAIGLTMPRAAVEICRQRLRPGAFDRAVILAEVFDPDTAVDAGFLDRLTPAGQVLAAAQEAAAGLALLDRAAHHGTKQRARAATLAALRTAIDADGDELRALL